MDPFCEFDDNGTCSVCKTPMPERFRNAGRYYRKCKSKPHTVTSPPRKGLGSSLAKVFKFCGIKQRPGCGCRRREDLLNRLGNKAYFTFIGLWNLIFPFWAKPLPRLPHRTQRRLTSDDVKASVMAHKRRISKNL